MDYRLITANGHKGDRTMVEFVTDKERVEVMENIRNYIYKHTKETSMTEIKDIVFKATIDSPKYWKLAEWKMLECDALTTYIISCEVDNIPPKSGVGRIV